MSSTPSSVAALSYDDIIFQARNRAYGAFVLRQQYRPTLSRSLVLGVGLFLAGLAGPTLYNRLFASSHTGQQDIMIDANLMKLPDKPIEQPVVVPPKEAAPTVSTVRNLPPVVMPEADVVEEHLPPTTEQLQDATSGTETVEGTGDVEAIVPPESAAPTVEEKAVEAAPKTTEPFVTVEQYPEYPGGLEAMRTFLGKNLHYPTAASAAGVGGKVYVSFVVNIDGSLTDIQVLKGIGFGCDEEALRVIQKMPRWKPGKQSGQTVRVKYNLPIVFALE